MRCWLRVDATLDEHPRILAAGPWGSVVAQAIWRVAKLFGARDGDVTTYWSAPYLARRLQLDGWRHGDLTGEALITQGMDAALAAGLLEQQEGRVFIREWGQYQPDPTAAERQRRRRANTKATDMDVTDVTRDARDARDVTKSHGTGRDITGQDKEITGSPSATPTPSKRSRPQPTEAGKARKRLLDYYSERWSAQHDGLLPALGNVHTALSACGEVLRVAGSDEPTARALVDRYLADRDPFVVERGHGIEAIRGQLNRLRARQTSGRAIGVLT